MAADRKPDRKPFRHVLKFDVLYFVAVLVAVLVIRSALVREPLVETIPHSEFQQRLASGGVTDVDVGSSAITGTYAAKGSKATPKRFSA